MWYDDYVNRLLTVWLSILQNKYLSWRLVRFFSVLIVHYNNDGKHGNFEWSRFWWFWQNDYWKLLFSTLFSIFSCNRRILGYQETYWFSDKHPFLDLKIVMIDYDGTVLKTKKFKLQRFFAIIIQGPCQFQSEQTFLWWPKK